MKKVLATNYMNLHELIVGENLKIIDNNYRIEEFEEVMKMSRADNYRSQIKKEICENP